MSNFNLNFQVNSQQLQQLVATLGQANTGAQNLANTLNGLNRINMNGANSQLNGLNSSVLSAVKGMSMAVAGLGAVGVAAIKLGKDMLEAQRTFDGLNTSLVTVTGSTEKATAAYAAIQKMAASTPFSVNELTKAFITLQARGLDPSEKALRSYGDTAAAMNKPIQSVIEAVADAVNGEFERTKEAFNVKASQMGDKVAFTFNGMTTVVKKNAEEIEKYLIGIGEKNFAGGMERQSKTLDGIISNLGDSWDHLMLTMSQTGPGDAAASMLLTVSGALGDLDRMIQAVSGSADTSGGKIKEYTGLHGLMTEVFRDGAFVGVTLIGVIKAIGDTAYATIAQLQALASFDWGKFKKAGQDWGKDIKNDLGGITGGWAALSKDKVVANAGISEAVDPGALGRNKKAITPEQRTAESKRQIEAMKKEWAGYSQSIQAELNKVDEAFKNGAISQAEYTKMTAKLNKEAYDKSDAGKGAKKAQTDASKDADRAFKVALTQLKNNNQALSNETDLGLEKLNGQYQESNMTYESYLNQKKALESDELNGYIANTDKAIAAARARGEKGEVELERLTGDREAYLQKQKMLDAKDVNDRNAWAKAIQDSVNEANKALGRSNQDRASSNKWAVAGVGMSDKRVQEASGLESLKTSQQRTMTDKMTELLSQGNEPGDAKDMLSGFADKQAQELNLYKEGLDNMKAAQADWTNGAVKSWQEYQDKAGDVAGQTKQIFDNAFEGMGNMVSTFVTTGKLNFKSFAASVLGDIASMLAKMALMNIAKAAMNTGVGSAVASAFGFAHGGAFTGGVQKMAQGEVVHGPRYFKMANGAGLMGEAGSEAVMPLKRMSDGNLGVRTQGGGNSGGMTIVNNISVTGATGNEDDNKNLAKMISSAIDQKFNENLAKAQRPGGVNNPVTLRF